MLMSAAVERVYSRWFEAQIGNAHPPKEHLHELHQASQRQSVISNDALYLMELAKMRCVHRFVSGRLSATPCVNFGGFGRARRYLNTLSMEKYRAGGTRPS